MKMHDSARIRLYMATGPREGRTHCPSADAAAAAVSCKEESLLYSYFQSGSSGCLRSQRGRRLRTVGTVAKLYSGGGELVVHSRVQASQGSFPALRPLSMDHSKLPTKTSTPAIWKNTPMVMRRFQMSQPRPGS